MPRPLMHPEIAERHVDLLERTFPEVRWDLVDEGELMRALYNLACADLARYEACYTIPPANVVSVGDARSKMMKVYYGRTPR